MEDRIAVRLSALMKNYLNTGVVFFLDLSVSVASTGVAIIITSFFVNCGARFNASWLLSAAFASCLMFVIMKSYRIVIRHTSIEDILRYGFVCTGKGIITGLALLSVVIIDPNVSAPIMIFWLAFMDALLSFVAIVMARVVMLAAYGAIEGRLSDNSGSEKIFVYGTNDKSVALLKRLQKSKHYRVTGFISSTGQHKGMTVAEIPVFVIRNEDDLIALKEKYSFRGVLFTTQADVRREQSGIVRFASAHGIKTLVTPGIDEMTDDSFSKFSGIREVKIEDLLGREEIKISMDATVKYFRGKTVLVTGAAGSIGSELCRQLASVRVEKLILFDNAETPVHNLRLELEKNFPELSFVPFIGDVRMEQRLDYVFSLYHPQVVFHAAAYKHVPLMEENPCEAVLVNVLGTRNVADTCIKYGVERMVMISTDKAVNPTNIMGCTKRLAEQYVQSLGLAIKSGRVAGKTRFVTTRFGNVLGSNGSVIPRFRQQIENGGPVTVTHPDITRFFMTIPEACRLVMEAATMAEGNEIFVFDMGESVKIDTLARKMIELAGLEVGEDIEIVYTGLRPGEKLYEEVLADEEGTVPTGNDRIRVALVRSVEYDEVRSTSLELEALASREEIPDMVKLMKKAVPEFKSKNSHFEVYDRK